MRPWTFADRLYHRRVMFRYRHAWPNMLRTLIGFALLLGLTLSAMLSIILLTAWCILSYAFNAWTGA